ncbi:MAG: hypothetical protein AB7F59_01365 [Bdellovibrionales bacterium]
MRLLKQVKTLWIVTLLFLFAACSTGHRIEDVDSTVSQIKSTLISFFRGNIAESRQESREMITQPFRPRIAAGRVEKSRESDELRVVARIRIIGNEKPYVLDVSAEIEERSPDGRAWASRGPDKRLAKQLSEAIQEYLQKNRNKNLIDHFRAF